MSNKIKLVVLDIDGVLNSGPSRNYNLEILKVLHEINIKSKEDNSIPAVTLATGRPGAYTEAVCQIIGGNKPAIYEHGTGAFDPEQFKTIVNPALGDIDALHSIYGEIKKAFIKNKQAYIQPGKEFSMSIFPFEDYSLDDIRQVCVDIIGNDLSFFDILNAQHCINIMPKGFHKGMGLSFLSKLTGIDQSKMLTVGDSEIDIPMLEAAGYSACPANANDNVHRAADYCAAKKYDQGLLEILKHFEIV